MNNNNDKTKKIKIISTNNSIESCKAPLNIAVSFVKFLNISDVFFFKKKI